MYKLLKLKNVAINISHISKINIHLDKYVIHLNYNKTTGFFFFGGGDLYSNHTKIEVCKINDYPDFYHISEFIDKHNHTSLW